MIQLLLLSHQGKCPALNSGRFLLNINLFTIPAKALKAE